MKRVRIIFGMLVLILWRVADCSATDGASGSAFDKIWGYVTLYENEENRFIQKFALSGRLQADAAMFDANMGEFDDEIWRRFRFGFKSNLFRDWVLHLEGDFNLSLSLSTTS